MLLAVFAICAVIFSVNGAPVGNVVFSAVVSYDRSFQTDEIMKYDDVFTNIGKAYNKDTGIFTAPKTGLYAFHIHGLPNIKNGFIFTLYHNDVPRIRAHGFAGRGSGGNSIALRVTSGERVYVKVQHPSTADRRGVDRYATFTGYLVAAEYDQ